MQAYGGEAAMAEHIFMVIRSGPRSRVVRSAAGPQRTLQRREHDFPSGPAIDAPPHGALDVEIERLIGRHAAAALWTIHR